MIEVETLHEDMPGCQVIMDLVVSQRHTLEKEVQKFCAEKKV